VDFNWFEANYVRDYFVPDDALVRASRRLAAWSATQKTGDSVTIHPVVPMLATAAAQPKKAPAWQFDLAEGSPDRYPLWVATTQYMWATGFSDTNPPVDWNLDQCDDRPACYGMHASIRRKARVNVAVEARSSFGGLAQWLLENWAKIIEFLKVDTPWGPTYKVILTVAKAALRFVWNGLKWIFHAFYDMTEEEQAAQPLGLESCPFGLLGGAGLPALPVTRAGTGSYALIQHPAPPPKLVVPDLSVKDFAWEPALP
jgi:hypothetical protein